jgi:hypothetical protein
MAFDENRAENQLPSSLKRKIQSTWFKKNKIETQVPIYGLNLGPILRPIGSRVFYEI